MSKSITARLPNPDCTTDANWHEWEQFIVAEGIRPADDPVIQRYQNLESSEAQFLDANWLNHYLTRAAQDEQSNYPVLAETEFGSLEPEDSFHATASAMDAVFAANSYRFSADSAVFKGVSSSPYYLLHRFNFLQPGQTVTMPGFLSTSVCRDKALDFARSKGVLLVLRGLEAIDAVVPPNSFVHVSPRRMVPEQEIILNRDTIFLVESVVERVNCSPREVHLRATGSRPRP